MKVIALFGLLLLAGCTDATWKNYSTLGSSGEVTCYSGTLMIYHGTSTGKIQTVQNSDGWEFEDAATHKFVRVSGSCLIVN